MGLISSSHHHSPDDPAYKEGWTINIGGLRGTNARPPQRDDPQRPKREPPSKLR
jgi:hypothetical protein